MEVNRLISKSLQEMPASRRQRALAKGDLSKLIHMGLNENNYGMSPKAMEALPYFFLMLSIVRSMDSLFSRSSVEREKSESCSSAVSSQRLIAVMVRSRIGLPLFQEAWMISREAFRISSARLVGRWSCFCRKSAAVNRRSGCSLLPVRETASGICWRRSFRCLSCPGSTGTAISPLGRRIGSTLRRNPFPAARTISCGSLSGKLCRNVSRRCLPRRRNVRSPGIRWRDCSLFMRFTGVRNLCGQPRYPVPCGSTAGRNTP